MSNKNNVILKIVNIILSRLRIGNLYNIVSICKRFESCYCP